MRVNIDSSGLGYLQKNALAIALARPAPGADVLPTLAFSLPATSIVGTSFSISVATTIRCFAAGGVFASDATVVPGLCSPPLERADVAANGAVCVFADNMIGVEVPAPPMPGVLLIENASPGQASLSMGLAETFGNTADNSVVQAATLVKTTDTGMRWAMDLPQQAYLFLISDDVVAGTIVPATLYKPRPPAKATKAKLVTTNVAILVDPADENLVVTYNSRTHAFVKS
ncbi:MAG: hypothetical protein ACJ8EB_10260 [Allosphingosinicella sp.]